MKISKNAKSIANNTEQIEINHQNIKENENKIQELEVQPHRGGFPQNLFHYTSLAN